MRNIDLRVTAVFVPAITAINIRPFNGYTGQPFDLLDLSAKPRDNSKIDMQTDQINSKALVVAIPKGTTAAQLAAIAKAVDKAKLNGIKIKIVVTGK